MAQIRVVSSKVANPLAGIEDEPPAVVYWLSFVGGPVAGVLAYFLADHNAASIAFGVAFYGGGGVFMAWLLAGVVRRRIRAMQLRGWVRARAVSEEVDGATEARVAAAFEKRRKA